MASNVVKGTFIRFSGENTRVIDSQDLVKKRMDDFSGVLRERENANFRTDDGQNVFDDLQDPFSKLTEDVDEEGFKEISFADTAEHIGRDNVIQADDDFQEAGMTLSVDEVRAECEAMINKANLKADEIRTRASEEAQIIKANAREEGFAEGIEAGRAEGLEEYNLKIQELETEKEAIYAQYNSLLLELEPKMVETIVSIYSHVFGKSLYNRQDVVLTLLNKALSVAESDGGVTIYVSSDDYEVIVERQEELIYKTALHEVPTVLVREDLNAGQARIETSHGIIDCGIDTELSELEKALTMLSYERRG